MPSSIERIGERLGQVMADLARVSGDVRAARQLLALLGWDLPPGADDIGLAGLDVSQLAARIDDLTTLRSRADASDLEIAAAVAAVIDALVTTYDHVQSLAHSLQATPQYLSVTRITDEFFPRLADLVTIHAVGSYVPAGAPLGALLGLFEFTQMPADPAIFQVQHVRQVVRWDRISSLLADPTDVLHDVYGWGTPDFDGNRLVANIGRVLDYIAAEIAVRTLPRPLEEQLIGHPVPEADTAPATQLFVSLDKGLGFDAFDVGLSLFALRASAAGGADGGIGLSPYAFGTADASFPISDSLSLVLSSSADLQGGLTLLLRAGRDPDLLTGLFEPPGEGAPPASFGLALRAAAAAGGRLTLFSSPGLSVDAAALTTGLRITAGAHLNPTLTAAVVDGRVRVVPGRSDGFLASILPAEGITTTLNLEVTWSQRDGVRIQGGAGLRTTLALHQKIGPLQLDTLDLALTTKPDELDLAVTVTGATLLGPLTAVVDSVGISVVLRREPGNLGNADITTQVKPPNRVGLSIDTAGVSGGGFLFFEPEAGQYAGIVQLQLGGGIAVTGLGLIATRLPDGVGGFSLLIILTAENFQPVPLPLGFRLTGIGGLLAVNRTFAEDVLRAGLKNHALDSVMFPHDPIRNAPQILSNLNNVFPAANGHHLFGPMAQLEWGTPTLLTAQVAVVLELGVRLRLLVLAQIAAILPAPDNDLIRLQFDAIGVVDFDQATAAVDASLYDSRLLQKFVLTGDMALRLKWAAPPTFAVAAGGLHPAFNPPPNFPKLERIAINLASGDNPRIRCEAYLALTGSSIQWGARAELSASAGGFSIQGEIGYDVLIQRDPFAFLADFYAQVQLKRGSTNLFKVRLEGALAGPRPLHIKATATFEILWWDVSIRVDRTLVAGEPPPLPAPVDVLPRLLAALGLPGSWVARLPAGQQQAVTLRGRPELAGEILLHPLGRLTVSQTVVPLGMDISRFGDATPAGARRFTITRVTPDGQPETPDVVRDFFAPAQFFEMTDDEKLSRPSFESLPAGVSLGVEGFAISASPGDWLEVPAIQFETVIVGQGPDDGHTPPPPEPYRLTAVLLDVQARFGAAANSRLLHTGQAKYRTTIVGRHRVAKEGWSIVGTEDLTVHPAPGVDGIRPASYSEAEQALHRLRREQPGGAEGLTILRLSEVRG